MAWANPEPGVFRPSRVLGLLLCIIAGLFLGLVWWQIRLADTDPRQFGSAQWIVAFAAFTAMAGWITNAIVTVRNSVKQHTINILLQSRLSQAYMERVQKVNAAFFTAKGKVTKLRPDQMEENGPEAPLPELRYLLNYFEFVAVGIRHGDLDEALMKSSLRGILCGMVDVAEELIKARGFDKDGTPTRTFEHLRWLHSRWSATPASELKRSAKVGLFALAIAVPAFVAGLFLDGMKAKAKPLTTQTPASPAIAASAPASSALAPASEPAARTPPLQAQRAASNP